MTGRPARFEPVQITDLDPHPIQQHRGVALPPHTFSVAHPSRWAGPQCAADTSRERAAAVVEYAVWIAGRADLLAARGELHGQNLACYCPLDRGPCHREVLLDLADPPADPFTAGGHAMGLTLRRPWASLLLVSHRAGGLRYHTRSWSTDYRGPVALFSGTRIEQSGCDVATAAGLDPDWHTSQRGWLGAAVLVDVHRAHGSCCRPRRPVTRTDYPRYHWVFDAPARLARSCHGRGFVGLRPVSWSVLIRPSALRSTPNPASPAVDEAR
ncbi:MAG: hypothetical protein QOC62_1057 [Mycobacterium sp.]|nr:hypothetical protein [Mycobacterium sp.]